MKKLNLLLLGLLSTAVTVPAQVFYTEGHADIGIGHDGTNWDLHFHDDTGGTEYEPDDVVIVAGLNAVENRPNSSLFNFVGVGAGSPFYRLRQTNVAGRPFLGVGTEEFDAPAVAYNEADSRVSRSYSNTTGVWVTLELVDVVAPAGGHFSVYSNDPDGNGPVNWMSTFDGGITNTDKFILLDDGHEHTNYGFTVAGTYEVTVRAKFWDGAAFQTSPDATYTFQAVPEPASMAALGLGVVALAKRRKKSV
jgi:surface-anchored protein